MNNNSMNVGIPANNNDGNSATDSDIGNPINRANGIVEMTLGTNTVYPGHDPTTKDNTNVKNRNSMRLLFKNRNGATKKTFASNAANSNEGVKASDLLREGGDTNIKANGIFVPPTSSHVIDRAVNALTIDEMLGNAAGGFPPEKGVFPVMQIKTGESIPSFLTTQALQQKLPQQRATPIPCNMVCSNEGNDKYNGDIMARDSARSNSGYFGLDYNEETQSHIYNQVLGNGIGSQDANNRNNNIMLSDSSSSVSQPSPGLLMTNIFNESATAEMGENPKETFNMLKHAADWSSPEPLSGRKRPSSEPLVKDTMLDLHTNWCPENMAFDGDLVYDNIKLGHTNEMNGDSSVSGERCGGTNIDRHHSSEPLFDLLMDELFDDVAATVAVDERRNASCNQNVINTFSGSKSDKISRSVANYDYGWSSPPLKETSRDARPIVRGRPNSTPLLSDAMLGLEFKRVFGKEQTNDSSSSNKQIVQAKYPSSGDSQGTLRRDCIGPSEPCRRGVITLVDQDKLHDQDNNGGHDHQELYEGLSKEDQQRLDFMGISYSHEKPKRCSLVPGLDQDLFKDLTKLQEQEHHPLSSSSKSAVPSASNQKSLRAVPRAATRALKQSHNHANLINMMVGTGNGNDDPITGTNDSTGDSSRRAIYPLMPTHRVAVMDMQPLSHQLALNSVPVTQKQQQQMSPLSNDFGSMLPNGPNNFGDTSANAIHRQIPTPVTATDSQSLLYKNPLNNDTGSLARTLIPRERLPSNSGQIPKPATALATAQLLQPLLHQLPLNNGPMASDAIEIPQQELGSNMGQTSKPGTATATLPLLHQSPLNKKEEIECVQKQEGIIVARAAYSHIAPIWANGRVVSKNVSIHDKHP